MKVAKKVRKKAQIVDTIVKQHFSTLALFPDSS